MVQCYKQTSLTEVEKSCKNQCVKKLSCHHRCLSLCHSGDCDETEKCRRKVKLTCRCKHLKRDVECFLVSELSSDGKFLECNPSVCNIPKSPKDSQSGSKKRNRKKKNSECDKDVAAADANSIENDMQNEATNPGKSSFLVIMSLTGFVAVAAIVVALSFLND